MNTNIGKETRQKQIKAWLQAVRKNTDLLLAFPVEPVENEAVATFRQSVADKIGWLSEYLATNEWNFFAEQNIGSPLTIQIDAERAEEPHDEVADAERAAAMDAATEAEAADFVPQGEKPKKTRRRRKHAPSADGPESGVSMAEIEAAEEAAPAQAKQEAEA